MYFVCDKMLDFDNDVLNCVVNFDDIYPAKLKLRQGELHMVRVDLRVKSSRVSFYNSRCVGSGQIQFLQI